MEYSDILGDDRDLLAQFLLEVLTEGIYHLPDGRMYVSTAHSEEDIKQTLEAFLRALRKVGLPTRS
jgi:glutamate-1-semialdehyde aminotransferase